MTALIAQGNALRLPLRDESVDLIIKSPPYFALRSYRDGGEHYDGQIGSEPTPQAFLEALWAVTKECWRVLKPTGVLWVNLGDKRSGSGGHNNSGISAKSTLTGNGHVGGGPKIKATLRNAPDRYNQAAFGRPKSKMFLPHRYVIGCEDGLADPEGIGWVCRQDQVWEKANGLPESVTDRTRDSHEYWFMMTKQARYYSAVDEIREPHAAETAERYAQGYGDRSKTNNEWSVGCDLGGVWTANPLGKVPSSVWRIPSEPLVIPDAVREHYGLPDHFAAFLSEWPRRLILGWSPPGICTACGDGRRPVVDVDRNSVDFGLSQRRASERVNATGGAVSGGTARSTLGHSVTSTITGYACDCPEPTAPTRPAVVLDPFAGTGTTVMVARALGRVGIGVDLSMDYARLAKWRVFRSGHGAKAVARTTAERQGALL